MIERDEEKFDFENKSFDEKVKRSSTCYEMEEHEKKNVKMIKEKLIAGKYNEKREVEVHLEYLDTLLNKLKRVRKEEFSFCPSNLNLDSDIAEIEELSRKLVRKYEEFR